MVKPLKSTVAAPELGDCQVAADVYLQEPCIAGISKVVPKFVRFIAKHLGAKAEIL